MFCPQCKSEYRAGFTRCADCNVLLVEGVPASELPPPASLPSPGPDTTSLVLIHSFPNDGEAYIACSVLDSAGIDAMVAPPAQDPPLMARSFGIGLPATDLYVRSEDFVIANEILNRG